MKPLVIIGNSEVARMAHEYFTHDHAGYEVTAFAVDEPYIRDHMFMGLPVVALGRLDESFPSTQVDAFVAIGSQRLNRLRAEKFAFMKSAGYTLASYVSSKAFVWHNVNIGENCFVLENNTLQPFVEVGDNVTLWSGNHIGHGTRIEDHVFISSQVVISGFCRIGAHSFLGVNAAVAEGVEIGEDNFVSLGAVVAQSTEPNTLIRPPKAEVRKDMARRFARVLD